MNYFLTVALSTLMLLVGKTGYGHGKAKTYALKAGANAFVI